MGLIMARVAIRYRWRYFCEIRKKLLVTPYHCEESMIRSQHPEATPVESTREERIFPTTDDELAGNSTSAWLEKLKR